jgi:enoyl-CoA hydratase
METIDLKTIQFKLIGKVGNVMLNAPPGNAMNDDFFDDFVEITTKVLPNKHLKAIIIHPAGRHFSSGTDLELLMESVKNDGGNASNLLQRNLSSFSYFKTTKTPVICALKGICIGSGLELALFADYRIAAKGTVSGLPESTFGFIPGVGGIQNMMHLAGKAFTTEYALSGDTFNSATAFENNIVDYITGKAELYEFCLNFANFLPENYNPFLRKQYLRTFLDQLHE